MSSAAQDHVCGPDCQCGCEAGLTIPVRRPSTAAFARDRWSWYDPMTPPHYALFALGVALGATLVGLAWTVWLWV